MLSRILKKKTLTFFKSGEFFEARGIDAIRFAIEIGETSRLSRLNGGIFGIPSNSLLYYINIGKIYGWHIVYTDNQAK